MDQDRTHMSENPEALEPSANARLGELLCCAGSLKNFEALINQEIADVLGCLEAVSDEDLLALLQQDKLHCLFPFSW